MDNKVFEVVGMQLPIPRAYGGQINPTVHVILHF